MHQRLRGKLAELNVRREAVASCLHCNIMTVSNKLNGKAPISCIELVEIARRFGFSDAEVLYILFGPKSDIEQQ